MIQVHRQDFNGRMITIRAEDVRAIACLFGVTPDSMGARLDELGLLVQRVMVGAWVHPMTEPIHLAEHQGGGRTPGHHAAEPLPVHRRGRSGRLQVRPGHPHPGGRRGAVHRGQPDLPGQPRAPLSRGEGERPRARRTPTAGPPSAASDAWRPTACSAASWPATSRPTSSGPTSARWPSGTSTRRRPSTCWWSRGGTSSTPATVTAADADDVAALLWRPRRWPTPRGSAARTAATGWCSTWAPTPSTRWPTSISTCWAAAPSTGPRLTTTAPGRPMGSPAPARW